MAQNPYQPPLFPVPTLADEQRPKRGPRPFGIWLLSGLHVLAGLAFLAIAIGLLAGAAAGWHDATGPIRADWLLTLGLGALATYAIASGVGLWRGDRWGWWLSALYHVGAAISFVGEGSITVWRMREESDDDLPIIAPVMLVRLLVHVLLVLYFFKGSVRHFFGLQSLSMIKALAILTAITIAFGVAMGFVIFAIRLGSR